MSTLERAVLETLAYSDIFDYPLTLRELHRYLTVPATQAELESCLKDMPFVSLSVVDSRISYYFLPQRSEIVDVRKARQADSLKAFQRALFYGRIIGRMPFVRLVTMTGSLAVLNLSGNGDMDFMLVTKPGRLWIARAFAVTFGRLMRLVGDRICVNLLVSENALSWPVHDLYSAREMGQMVPIVGLEVYNRLRASNQWTVSFLPNSSSAPDHSPSKIGKTGSLFQRILELPMLGKFGAWLDNRLMKFQIRKIIRKYGKSAEANFTVDVCQGNFHGHRQSAGEFFKARLKSLGLDIDEESVQ